MKSREVRYVGAMNIDEQQIARLVAQPSEGLNVEVKTWIDPRLPDGVAKLVKATFALRNRNGGFLLIGFDDTTLRPDPYALDVDPDALYHLDAIQRIVSRYASQAFEVAVSTVPREGQRHPVIAVEEGVRVPVVVKSDLRVNGGKFLLRERDIYFRTLGANGTPSTANILPGDLPDLLDICFDNREADIGRFLRRQLGAADIGQLAGILQGLSAPPAPGLRQRAIDALDEGESAFTSAIGRRPLPADKTDVLELLTMRVAMVLEPEHAEALPTREFLNRLDASNPQYTGWPVWFDSSASAEQADRPVVREGAWEALIVALDGGWSEHLDFMRFDPTGSFFLRRLMQDDLSGKVTPGTALDAMLMTYRVTEAIAVGISMTRATGWSAEDRAGFAFRWTALEGRRVQSWANPLRSIGFGSGASATASVDAFVEVPLDTPHLALAPYVAKALAPLFAVFGGFEVKDQVIEEAVRQLVERKLPG